MQNVRLGAVRRVVLEARRLDRCGVRILRDDGQECEPDRAYEAASRRRPRLRQREGRYLRQQHLRIRILGKYKYNSNKYIARS